jgi:Leucine-rich repeat (LRR) protein
MPKAKAKAAVGPPPMPPAPVPRQTYLVLDGPLGVGRVEAEQRVISIMSSLVFQRISDAIREGHLSLDLSALGMQEAAPTPLPLWTSVLNLSNNLLRADALSMLHSGVLPTLRSLSLAGCALVGQMPQALGALATTLEELDLSRNRISSLPENLSGPLRALRVLSLTQNALVTLPSDLFSPFGCGTALQRIDLRGNQLATLPDSLCVCARLESLLLSDNKLTCLPEGIGGLRALRILDVSHNALTELPTDLARCESLELLDLTHNLLTILPEPSILGLKRLCELRASSNKLVSTPDTLGSLRALRILALASNALSSLPSTLGGCVSLEELYVANNAALSELPENIGECALLRFLDARWTKLKALPPGTEKWTKLALLDATGKKKNTLKMSEDQARGLGAARIVGATVVKAKAKKK